jgi:OOP family OmpA-OmpF porin
MSPHDPRTRWTRRAAAVALLAALIPLVQGCGDNRLPVRALPEGEGPRPLPAWYPEAPWNARDGQTQVFIEGKIVFDTDRAEIRPGSEKVLETLLQFANEHVEVSRLRIEGHTDARATEEHNQELSARRALAVAHWLVDRGVEPTRLLAVGFGESRPLGPNAIAEGRAENRRVEFHVVEVNGMPFNTKDPTGGGMSLQVLSKLERDKLAAASGPKSLPPPAPFKATGDEVKQVDRKVPVVTAPNDGEGETPPK